MEGVVSVSGKRYLRTKIRGSGSSGPVPAFSSDLGLLFHFPASMYLYSMYTLAFRYLNIETTFKPTSHEYMDP